MGVVGGLKATFGVHFSPEEFVLNSQKLVHPFDIPLPLDNANMDAIGFILQNGPAVVAKRRADMLGHYVKRAKELHSEEAKLHAGLDELVRPVLRSKRLLLFREMLADAGVNDATLMDEMCAGFRLVGDLEESGQSQPHFKPAVLSLEQLKQTAVWAQKAVTASCKKVLDDLDIAAAVRDETMDQASDEERWVVGPFSAEQVTERLGNLWVPSRRFGVRQNNKISAVDDFSQFLINSAVTCHEKIDFEGINSICATARFFLGAPTGDGRWLIPADGEPASGSLSRKWTGGTAVDLFGRCLDLKHAYKQLVRHPAHQAPSESKTLKVLQFW